MVREGGEEGLWDAVRKREGGMGSKGEEKQ